MKAPSFTAIFKDNAWTCAYVGDDAGKAKDAFKQAIDANSGGAMLFIRPSFTRRFRGQPLPSPIEPKQAEQAPADAKPKKGGK